MHERKSESEVIQSCPTFNDPMDCSLPGSSVHGIFQARVLEWGAIAFSITVLKTVKDFSYSSFYPVGISYYRGRIKVLCFSKSHLELFILCGLLSTGYTSSFISCVGLVFFFFPIF